MATATTKASAPMANPPTSCFVRSHFVSLRSTGTGIRNVSLTVALLVVAVCHRSMNTVSAVMVCVCHRSMNTVSFRLSVDVLSWRWMYCRMMFVLAINTVSLTVSVLTVTLVVPTSGARPVAHPAHRKTAMRHASHFIILL